MRAEAMQPIRDLAALDGPLGRAGFWLGSLLVALVVLALKHLPEDLLPFGADVPAFAESLAILPWSLLAARRAIDRGRSPLYGMLLVVGIVLLGLAGRVFPEEGYGLASLGLWLVALVDLGLLPGKPGPAAAGVAPAAPAAKPVR
jgi:uncharacterized membrane protein YhaH (DUF805 family)